MSTPTIRIKRLATSDRDEKRIHDRIKVAGLFITTGRMAEALSDLNFDSPRIWASEFLDLGQEASIVISPDTSTLDLIADASEGSGLTVNVVSSAALGFFAHILRDGIDRPTTIYLIDSVLVSPVEYGEAIESFASDLEDDAA